VAGRTIFPELASMVLWLHIASLGRITLRRRVNFSRSAVGAIRKYLFSDESGDLQCRAHPNVSKYFAVGTLVVTEQQLASLRAALVVLRDELAWRSHGLDSTFHATEDKQHVRDQVFAVLAEQDFRFAVTVIEKSKAQPKIRPDEPTLFQYQCR
jgi:hypothetical protein